MSLLLVSTSDKIQLITGSAVTINVHASYMDYNGTTVTPGRKNTAITTAATTDIVAAPGSSVQRNVKSIFIRNKHATLSCFITTQHTDGSIISQLNKTELGPGGEMMYSDETGFAVLNQGAELIPDWHGLLYATYGRCDPQQLLRMATMAGTIAATPTNITASIARISYFRPPADITVNSIRFYGAGSTANLYSFGLYNGDTLARLANVATFSTTANVWGVVASSLGLALLKDQLYFAAVSVVTTGTTAGILCMGATPGASTGAINVLPKNWPGSLSLNGSIMDGGFAQFAVSTGVMPDPANTIAAQPTNWTGGMPLFFLDNNNA